MIDNNTVSPRSSRSFPVAAIVGGVVLVAALGAAAGWMGHSAHSDPAVAAAPSSTNYALTSPDGTTPAAAPSTQAPTYANNGNAPVYTPPSQAPNGAQTQSTQAYGTANSSGTYAATGNAPYAPPVVQQSAPPVQQAPVRVAQAPCGNCGVIDSVRAIQVRPEQGSGVGAVGGGVLGGVLGHQFGGGTGRGVMTALGVVGGAVAGNEVEKRVHTKTEYEVHVRMEDGHYRTFTQTAAPATGSHVVVEGHSFRVVSSHYRDGHDGA